MTATNETLSMATEAQLKRDLPQSIVIPPIRGEMVHLGYDTDMGQMSARLSGGGTPADRHCKNIAAQSGYLPYG